VRESIPPCVDARHRRYNAHRRSSPMSRLLITLGVVLLVAGLAWPLLAKLGLGRLPGDIRFVRGGFGFYFPLTSGLIVSAIVSVVLWILRR